MILVINTASEKNSVALYWQYQATEKQKNRKTEKRRSFDSDFFVEESWSSYQTQSQELLPRINQLLTAHRVRLEDLQAIAIYQGPGSYTGLRVGISVANALAWSLDIPVIGIKNCQTVKLLNCRKKNSNLAMEQFSHLWALEIAKRAYRIHQKKKDKRFQKIVLPYYNKISTL